MSYSLNNKRFLHIFAEMKAIKKISHIFIAVAILIGSVGIGQFRHVCLEDSHEIVSVMPNVDCCSEIQVESSCCAETSECSTARHESSGSEFCHCDEDFQYFNLNEVLILDSKKIRLIERRQLCTSIEPASNNTKDEIVDHQKFINDPVSTPRSQIISYLISSNSPNDSDPFDFS